MVIAIMRERIVTQILTAILAVFLVSFVPQPAAATPVDVKQAIAEAAQRDTDLAAFYKEYGYKTVWVGRSGKERKRRTQLFKAIERADLHGLPVSRYNPEALKRQLRDARTATELGEADVALSRAFLTYARDVQSGLLVPGRMDRAIFRKAPLRDRKSYMSSFVKSNPAGFLKALPPKTDEYTALMKEKLALEKILRDGGWRAATVRATKLERGDTGKAVVALRQRLTAMGYMRRSNTQTYDDDIVAAVKAFQRRHGLSADGVAGKGTMGEINRPASDRLRSVIVAMERERWMNKDRGKRHVEVNIPDFKARIIDNGRVTFETRAVVGARIEDRPTPEFSDEMEFMVINPSWYVPRSIVTKEYLPELQANPYAVRHIELTDANGRVVNRGSVDFTQFDANTFPFAMREPPSQGNALGLVKFMFPNRHNIYLHDTPAKNLFGREVRAYSHGCVRLADPFDFAYALLAKQSSNPKGLFHSILDRGVESQLDLKQHVPVHIIYRTAFASAKGEIQYRRDIYGRDGRIWKALSREGVELPLIDG